MKLLLFVLAGCVFHVAFANADDDVPSREVKAGSIVDQIASEATEVASVVSNAWVVNWLQSAQKLESISPRKLTVNGKEVSVDERTYYLRYGSPMAYARALDLAVTAGFEGVPGSRIFDFGYGSIGYLRMMAHSGMHATGVDVAPLLKAMYEGINGKLGSGSVHVFDGRFPKDRTLVEAVGRDYDLVVSKNVLKKGYIHPSREVADPRTLIDLGVSDDQFLADVYSVLKPTGLFIIYNFCPAKAALDKPYIPWAEGESPFTQQAFVRAGFEILQFDVVDHFEARRIARALKWDVSGGMDIESDLFAWYTIVQKPMASSVKP